MEKNSDKTECVLPAGKSWKDYSEVCKAEGRAVSFAGDQCTDKCPENEKTLDNVLCVCDDESITYEN